MNQLSIKRPFELEGITLHSGAQSKILFRPSPPDSGRLFIKGDQKIPALVDRVTDTRRGTTLGNIAVVEHLLAALSGLGIDNIEIELEGDEVPVMDGSALPFVEAFLKVGLVDQGEPRNFLILKNPILIDKGETSLEAAPDNRLVVDFMVNFPGIEPQRLVFDQETNDFCREIAPARTFGYLEDYEALKNSGLAHGASYENALVLGKDGYKSKPRFPDEVVRHKVLDLIGDLALIGRPLHARVTAKRSGHKLNVELVRRILTNG